MKRRWSRAGVLAAVAFASAPALGQEQSPAAPAPAAEAPPADLADGGAKVPVDRRNEVEAEILALKPRVAEVTVTVHRDGAPTAPVDDAEVFADDVPVCTATAVRSCTGRSPLASPILLNAGRRKITATKRGYMPRR